jgi:hypothetical protein
MQAARIVELEAALEAFLIAHENNNTDSDGNNLADRMEAIGAISVWISGEDLQEYAVYRARRVLAEAQS